MMWTGCLRIEDNMSVGCCYYMYILLVVNVGHVTFVTYMSRLEWSFLVLAISWYNIEHCLGWKCNFYVRTFNGNAQTRIGYGRLVLYGIPMMMCYLSSMRAADRVLRKI